MKQIVVLIVSMLFSCAALAGDIQDEVVVCSACHGETGKPIEATIPIIWGQTAGYLYLQLRDFQKGARKDERMSAVVEQLPKEDLLALAEYFSAKPWPNLGQPAANKADTASAQRVNDSVVCTSCHLAEFQGDSSVPRTAGQQRDYLAKTMLDFRTGARANNPGMSSFMHAVTPEEIAALANYLAGLSVEAPR